MNNKIISIAILILLISTSSMFTTSGQQGSSVQSTFTPSYGTQSNGNITISSPIPINDTTHVYPWTGDYNTPYTTAYVEVIINHTYGKEMNVSSWTNATGTWWQEDWDQQYNGTYYGFWFDDWTEYNTMYWWSINVTNHTDSDIVEDTWLNQTFRFTTGNQTHCMLDNLSWDGLTFRGSDISGPVWCNGTDWINETMCINITVNDTVNVHEINIWMSDLYYSGGDYEVGASNFTVYVSGNESMPNSFFPPFCDIGFGDGVFRDARDVWESPNITINDSTWDTIPNNPWVQHGDGTNITENCTIYVRIKMDMPNWSYGDRLNVVDWSFYSWDDGRVYLNDTEGIIYYSTFDTQFEYEMAWIRKQGYDNSTWGPPDFDQKQSDWYNESGNWVYCGPVALLNCLWWLDCKYNNITKNYILPDEWGFASKDPNNVIPLVDWIAANFTNTSKTGLNTGTTAENMTTGIYEILNQTNDLGIPLSAALDLTVEGYHTGQIWDEEIVNYTNISSYVENCSDVILLIGFWCEAAPMGAQRFGGHYVQVSGFNNLSPGLMLSDPYRDHAEDNYGFASSHNHDEYGNSSHNWTQNISYDYYNVSVNTNIWFDGFWQLDNYTDDMGCTLTNFSQMNWYDECYDQGIDCTTDVFALIEVAWYIHESDNCSVNVTKTIWNGTAWTDRYENLTIGQTVTTNITIMNMGSTIRSMEVYDNYRDVIEPIVDESRLYRVNGSYAREPDYNTTCDYSTCEEPPHGGLYWYLNHSELGDFMFGDTVTIHTNWTVYSDRYADNNASVDICLNNDSCLDWDYANCTGADEVYLNAQFNYSIVVVDNGIEKSEWNISEHINRSCTDGECYDQEWSEYETEFEVWSSTDTMASDWGWVYRYYDPNGDKGDGWGLSYTIANWTAINRSMSHVRLRYDYDYVGEDPGWTDPLAGVIYSFINNSHYDMVLYGNNQTYLISKRGGWLWDTVSEALISFPSDAINHYSEDWICNQTMAYGGVVIQPDIDGIWVKTLYNEFCGTVMSKAWNVTDLTDDAFLSLCDEPAGWIVEEEGISLIQDERAKAFGLVVWNPQKQNDTDMTFYAYFDFINMWRLNYSRDDNATASQIENHSVYEDDGIPIMYFPTYDIVESWDAIFDAWVEDCFYEWQDGNISNHSYIDCSYCTYRNLSTLFNMESRMTQPRVDCGADYLWDNQNDTTYYYTTISTNNSAGGANYENGLIIEIQDTSDGTETAYDGAVVAIDIDNNMQWDDNDMCFIWRDDDGDSTFANYTIYRGQNIWRNESMVSPTIDCIFSAEMANCPMGWKDNYLLVEDSLPALHRYSDHRIYYALIPLKYLRKSNGEYLNANDTFGLHIMNVHASSIQGIEPVDAIPVWENWNESNCSVYTYEDITVGGIWETYLNLTIVADINSFYFGMDEWDDLTSMEIENWAHGRIGNEVGQLTYDYVSVECSCAGEEEGALIVSELTLNGTLDYNWSEYEPDRWLPWNSSLDCSICPNWDWVYSYNNTDGSGGDINSISFTMANDSCSNRSQSLVRMRWNGTHEGPEPYLGVIYSFRNDTNWDAVFYGLNNTFLLSLENGTLIDTLWGNPVTDDGDAWEYWYNSWACNSTYNEQIDTYCNGEWEGLWSKVVYNSLSGDIQAKAWVADFEVWGTDWNDTLDLAHEPSGWILEYTSWDIRYDEEATCFGLATWNPYGMAFTADFGFVKDYRLNSTKDGTATVAEIENHWIFEDDGIPLMNFPRFNMTIFNNTKTQWQWWLEEWQDENILNVTFAQMTDVYTASMLADMSMESRFFEPEVQCIIEPTEYDDQNDTIYYYTAITDNLIAIEDEEYDSAIRIHIEDCTDGTEDQFDGAIIAIDVDNDMTWDDNDMLFYWYDGDLGNTNFTIWNGTTLWRTGTGDDNYSYDTSMKADPYNWTDVNESFPALHRYSYHRVYEVSIPLSYFAKKDGHMLNVEDKFGLHIMTINARPGEMVANTCPVWENYNESNNSYYLTNNTWNSSTFNYYLNCSTVADVQAMLNGTLWQGVNDSNIQYWGFGYIENTTGEPYDEPWELNASMVVNISQVTNVSIWTSVNYTITICNNDTEALINIVVNDTIPTGATYVGSSLPAVNVTNPSGDFYIFNASTYLNASECTTFDITINYSAYFAPNGTTITNSIVASTTYFVNATAEGSFIYGDNTPPSIDWVYPANGSTDNALLLHNMSAGISDADANYMNITFYTNKSIGTDGVGWSAEWSAIGSNGTVLNGTYQTNQSYNNSLTYNTRWRWYNTTYYWWINVSDDNVWTNESFLFTTNYTMPAGQNARMNVYIDDTINVVDLSADWGKRTVGAYSPYYGLYDLDDDGIVNVVDLSYIWGQRTV